MRLSLIALSLLLAAPAGAEEDAAPTETSDDGADEAGSSDEDPAGPELIPEASDADETEAEADEPPLELTPEPEPEPEAEPKPEPEAEEPEAEELDRVIADLDRAPWFTLQLGGIGTQMLDAGWSMLRPSDGGAAPRSDELLTRGHVGLDVYPHPHIGVSAAFSRRPDASRVIRTAGDPLSFTSTFTSLDVAAKFILAPPFLVLRPYARAGAGFFAVDVVLSGSGTGNLKTRTYGGAAPYATVGGGIEIVTPRVLKRSGGDARLRWGVGWFVEGGATLGGGSEAVPGAPTVDLGALGDLSMGPAYVRMGLVLLL